MECRARPWVLGMFVLEVQGLVEVVSASRTKKLTLAEHPQVCANIHRLTPLFRRNMVLVLRMHPF